MTNPEKRNTALILGASGGIGSAFVAALEQRDDIWSVLTLSRSIDGLDLTSENQVTAAASRIDTLSSKAGGIDLIVNATGVLAIDEAGPEKSFSAIDPSRMEKIFRLNTIGAALAIKHFAPLLAKDRRAVFASLSARVGSIGDNRLGGWISYRASKAALNQVIRCASVEVQRTHPEAIMVALHPGTIETDLTRKFARGRYTASPEDGARQMLATLDELSTDDTGGFFAYDGKPIEW
ncbi:MAG: SDR family NAD(P)-dependent oxidoreductase [Pseudomonadota bacterium]